MRSIILILGDQLTHDISALQNIHKDHDIVLMCEVMQECTTPRHHKKKIAFVLSCMRHFAEELKNKNCNLEYITLDDAENTQSLKSEVLRACNKHKIQKVTLTHPGEYRVLQDLLSLSDENIDVEVLEDTRFLCSTQQFTEFAARKKSLLMESFYRQMRSQYNILMIHDKPIGGKWNYDKSNRQAAKSNLTVPQPYTNKPDTITTDVINLVNDQFANHFGDIEPFHFAVTRAQAQDALQKFIDERLADFGTYQDAMLENQDFMFHSHIGWYLNNGLLDPLETIKLVENEYNKGKIEINSAEGFIRQILGWREYIRGIYWLKMPGYKELNFFNATAKLPHFFWDADTDMNCMKQCINNTQRNSYAHHIQRLMVLGNFALIAGINPVYVNEWYLIVYTDAYEWVELPNVSGMVLFADGGILATKPYAASGAYINKMSNYCKNCSYSVTVKNGDNACPFNYLYWNFLIKHKEVLAKNHRMSMIYKVLEKFTLDKITQIQNDSQVFLDRIDARQA